jgi:TolB protein
VAIVLAAGLVAASAFASVERGPARNGLIAFTRVDPNGTSSIFTIDPRSRRLRRLTGPYSPPPDAPVWAPDGSISYDAYSGLTLVDPVSGRTRQLSRAVQSEAGFAWSPDGRRLVLQRGSGLVIVTRGGKLLRRLTRDPNDERPAWSPDGHTIAFERSIEDIFLVASDGTHLRRLGTGVEPAWSPDGRQVVFSDCPACPGDVQDELMLVNVDGSGRRQLTETAGCSSRDAAWAPGSQIAVSCNGSLTLVDPATGMRTALGISGDQASWSPSGAILIAIEAGGLKLVDVTRHSERALELVPPPGSDDGPAWAPDGRSLAVTSDGEVRVLTTRGTKLRTVPGAVAEPRWAPDGRRLIALTDDCCTWSIIDLRTGAQDAVLVDAGNGDPTPCSPAWSPGGRWIAFSQADPSGLGLYDVRRRRERLLKFGGSHADWAPNGRRLVFDTTEECVGGPSRRASIFVARTDGRGLRRLARNASDPAWSPDGRRIAFVRIVGRNNPEIYVMNADGSRQLRLTRHRGIDVAPDWQRRRQ